jgi:hypothetical protein
MSHFFGDGLVPSPDGASDAGLRVGVVEQERQDHAPLPVGLFGPLGGVGREAAEGGGNEGVELGAGERGLDEPLDLESRRAVPPSWLP